MSPHGRSAGHWKTARRERHSPARRSRALTGTLLGTVLGLMLGGCGAPGSQEPLRIDDAHIRPPVAGGTTTAGYFEITNLDEEIWTLTGAESGITSRIEMHTHIRDGDIMRMRPLDALEIPPGETLRFETGGHHLMLYGLEGLPQDGERVEVTLHFEAREAMTVGFEVRAR